MNALQTFIQKYLYSDKLPLQARVVNLVLLIGGVAALASLVLRLASGFNPQIIGLNISVLVAVSVLFIIANRTQRYKIVGWIACIAVADIMWPLLFFYMGGVSSGITAFFVLSTVAVFLLIRGKWLPFMLLLHLAFIVTVYALGYFYPQLVIPLTPDQQPIDHVISIIIVGLCIGFILIYKDMLHSIENEKVQSAMSDLELTHCELAVRDKLLASNNEAARLLLSAANDDNKNNIELAMRHVGESLGIARMYIWKNIKNTEGKAYAQSYGWSTRGIAKERRGKSQVWHEYAERIPRWHALFLKNEIVNSEVDELPSDEAESIAKLGARSVLAIPLYNKDQFWGYVSFDNFDDSQVFGQDTVAILRSFSLMLANAMIRVDLDRERSEALEQAVQASKAKGAFLSNMSHEMRTPMNAIIGMTSIGLSAETIQRKDYAFNRIDIASKHLLGVINDILDISKIEAGKLELTPVEFCLSKTIDRVIDVMNFRIEERSIKCQVVQAASIPPLLIGDDQRLAQVITNLLSNAIKFSDDGGDLLLQTKLVRQQGNEVEIEFIVKDNGIGISDEQQSRLFRSFEQAESSTSRKFGGTGLGLAISKRIVELMGGKIWIESALGAGSSFIFTSVLGLARGSESFGDDLFFMPQANPVVQPEVILEEDANLQGKRILLAEDVDINQEIVKALLEPTGVEIEIAHNGLEALAMFSADPLRYNMIFMDVQMPQMDGMEATRQIRALGSAWAKEIPIVAMTANVFREDVENCLLAGMDDHIGKPLNYEEVLKKLQENVS